MKTVKAVSTDIMFEYFNNNDEVATMRVDCLELGELIDLGIDDGIRALDTVQKFCQDAGHPMSRGQQRQLFEAICDGMEDFKKKVPASWTSRPGSEQASSSSTPLLSALSKQLYQDSKRKTNSDSDDGTPSLQATGDGILSAQ